MLKHNGSIQNQIISNVIPSHIDTRAYFVLAAHLETLLNWTTRFEVRVNINEPNERTLVGTDSWLV